MLATAAFNFKRMMNKWKKKFFHFFQTLFLQFETFEKLKDFLITIFFDYKKPFPLSRHREFLPSRHCEPKGWQVCWREAISLLHIPVGVKCFEGIASLTVFARNDVVGLQTCNDVTKTLLIALQRS